MSSTMFTSVATARVFGASSNVALWPQLETVTG